MTAGDEPDSVGEFERQARFPNDDSAMAEYYRTLVEDASDFTLRLDGDRVVEWVSPSVTAVLGWLPEDMVGRSAFDFVDPAQHEFARDVISRRDAGEKLPARWRVLAADGSYRWVDQVATIIYDADGTVIGAVSALRSVDEQVRLESELAAAQDRYRELAERAEEAEDINQRLVALTWTDYLTGLASRGRIESVLDSELGMLGLIGGSLCALLVSVNGLPEVRAALGHQAVDASIAEYAEVVREHLAPGGIVFEAVGRWADDQFLAILSGTDMAQARDVAERTQSALRERSEALSGPTSCSVVITEASLGESIDHIVTRLAAGRYRALDEGLEIVEML